MTVPAQENRTLTYLLYGGPILLVVGIIIAAIGKYMGDQAVGASEFTSSLGGFGSNSAGAAGYGWGWFGVVVAVVGVVLLIVGLAIRAAKS